MFKQLKNGADFSFLLDGVSFNKTNCEISQETAGNIKKTTYFFNGGLKLTNILTFFQEYDACEWVNHWENTGSDPSGIISELWDADVEIPFDPSEPKMTGPAYLPESENVIKIYAPRGSEWSDKEFSCDVDKLFHNHFDYWLSEGSKRTYASFGGRSSDSGNAPFFNVTHGKKPMGFIAAVGWTGQWNAYFERRSHSVIFKSKIEDTNFRIMPGESFRTSSVTLMSYTGAAQDGQNKWRRFVKEIYSPIGKREVPALPPFCAGLWGGMSTEGCLSRIATVEKEKLPFDHYWMDAGWYGGGCSVSPDEYEGDWHMYTGNWEVNKFRHPDDLLDVTKAIKNSGKRFLLWFEPERVRETAPILEEHPEFLLKLEGDDRTFLYNLGDNEAWQHCFDTLSTIIERLNISVYRQDFNFHPIAYWRQNDTSDRRGITEIKHINGLYRLWDALLAKFPYLLIDNCASGGRRIDIETLRRSVPLWRSDAQCPANPVPEITQAHAAAHSMWMPYSGTSAGRVWFDTYRFRSAYAPAMSTNFTFSERNSFGDDPEKIAWFRQMCEEYLRIRPYLSKDVYPLTLPSDTKDIWSAIQYHDTETDSGVILAFRRENAPYSQAEFSLGGISAEKDYVFEDADGETEQISGKELTENGFALTIKEKRASKLIFYSVK